MDAVEVPRFFVCPISLQIMKDPVTASTGITYDRDSIERWLFVDNNATCPVTNQPLPRDTDLTPNHTLRRLIQGWCTLNASLGVDRIPTPRAPATRPAVLNLLHDLSHPHMASRALRLLATLASDSESNRRCMLQAGAARRVARVVLTNQDDDGHLVVGEALTVLHALRPSPDELTPLVQDMYHELVDSIIRFLKRVVPPDDGADPRSHAMQVLRSICEAASPTMVERLKPDFFEAVVSVLRLRTRTSTQATKAALQVLLQACPLGTNRNKIAEAGAVAELVELELTAPDKRTSELVLGVLDHLCGCAHGRAELVGHAAGIAVVAKRAMRVSPAADERAVGILSSVCRYSGTGEVLQEMLRVGAVSKLCWVLQADCSTSVKEKARWVLRLHSEAWRNSPCIASYLLTRR